MWTHKFSAFSSFQRRPGAAERSQPSVTEVLHCGVGQQPQDGGEAVQLLLDVLWKLLVLFVPAGGEEEEEEDEEAA